jgi:hypothetical protein
VLNFKTNKTMENLILDALYLSIIVITGIAISVFWRTCIYSRGGIFRVVGRLLDRWVAKACLPTAGLGSKILRFLAYPLGRCIYCSSFHFMYDTFFILNSIFSLKLNIAYLIIILPVSHLFLIVFMRHYIIGNKDLEKGDWEYMKGSHKILDLEKRHKIKTVLTAEEEINLELCKGNTN